MKDTWTINDRVLRSSILLQLSQFSLFCLSKTRKVNSTKPPSPVRSPESAGFILRPESGVRRIYPTSGVRSPQSGGFLSVGLSIRRRTIHMEVVLRPQSAGFIRSPEDLSVGPSIWKEVVRRIYP